MESNNDHQKIDHTDMNPAESRNGDQSNVCCTDNHFDPCRTDATKAIVTIKPDETEAGLNELHQVAPDAKLEQWLDDGLAVIQLPKGFDNLASEWREHPPIFVQHMCPVHLTVSLANRVDDVPNIVQHVQHMHNLLQDRLSFSVQTRMSERFKPPYKRFTVNEAIATNVAQKTGLKLDVKKPEQIVSVVVTEGCAFVGVSLAACNLSDWAGGKRRFAQEKGQISRAEFKLLEAIEVFGISMPSGGWALDLGAAPGGWTRVLRKHNINVVAVDPAKLDRSLVRDGSVHHFRETAQLYFKRDNARTFALIVNDMRLDTKESVALMGEAAERLKEGGFAVVTLKLPKRHSQKTVTQAVAKLERWYNICGVRQLFHNRSEVTVYMQKK
ncbi:SAM-dependent methyltransferase [Numidum massiliense]|uniref:SAM-dependent methyltransferase n=1 Tax=Numidum massiliense TaxID=1522315 RepID=UPI0006D5872A|nr:SAM-dependent methyltransferase [Numidum massiliense]